MIILSVITYGHFVYHSSLLIYCHCRHYILTDYHPIPHIEPKTRKQCNAGKYFRLITPIHQTIMVS